MLGTWCLGRVGCIACYRMCDGLGFGGLKFKVQDLGKLNRVPIPVRLRVPFLLLLVVV